MTQPAISIRDLSVRYGANTVLNEISLDIPEGVAMAIVGPNGAGKSTLIKAILRLVRLNSGSVLVQGQAYTINRQAIAYVPQRSTVDWDFPTTVFDVVMMGTYGKLKWWQRPGQRQRDLAHVALERLGIADLSDRQIGQLSGGQQQRTFLARSLVQEASILLLDEPLQGVDAVTESMIVAILHELRSQGKTIVCVHHDLSTASEYFDHAALLNGKIIATGPSASVLTADHLKLAYGRVPV